MAIKKMLSENDKTNSYGIEFNGAYFKIEDVSTDFDLGIIKIYVRGYASAEARNKQKEIEANRKKYMKLSMGGEDFDKAFKDSKYKKEDEYRIFLEKEKEKYMQNIIGIYKEKFEVRLDDLKIIKFTKDGILTACYKYLKEQDIFKKGVDC